MSLCTRLISLMGLREVAEARVLGVLSTSLLLVTLRTTLDMSSLPGLERALGGLVGDVLGDLCRLLYDLTGALGRL